MKVAILSESPADEAAIRILVDGILGKQTEPVGPTLPAEGWTYVVKVLPSVLNHLHYETDAEAFVVVLDSDDTLIHQQSHDLPDGANEKCRLCKLRETVAQVLGQLRNVPGRIKIKTAVGLAIPAIEAWYLCGRDPHSNEATFAQKPISGLYEIRKRLKQKVYDTNHPSRELAIIRATEEAQRLAQNIDELESLFPNGFGPLARDVRKW